MQPYYAYVQGSTLPWSAYFNVSVPPGSTTATAPAQWGADPTMAAAAAALSHFSSAAPAITAFSAQEAYAMPSPDAARADPALDLLQSPWGVCMALLGQQASTLPLGPTAPAGFVDDGGVDLARRADLLAAVRNVTQAAMRSGCPFVWHRSRRHAPSPSTVCTSSVEAKPAPHAQGRMRVKGATLLTSDAGGFVVHPDEGRSFPLFGFLSRTLGEADAGAMCVCAFDHPTLSGMCQVLPETCASLPAGTTCLQAACAASGRQYALQDARAVLDCLVNDNRTHGVVRCPELGPSDLWGLYPVGCGSTQCDGARGWVGTGTNDVLLDGMRFMNDGRAGLRLPNYRFVNDTYHTGIHYGLGHANDEDGFLAQRACLHDVGDLAPSAGDDDAVEDLAALGLEALLPAAQLVSDSPLVAVCARYVLEDARARLLESTGMPAAENARLQANDWARRCAAKAGDALACQMAGVFFDVPPPAGWRALAEARCGVRTAALDDRYYYIAPQGCVLVDRVARQMYDARLCTPPTTACAPLVILDLLLQPTLPYRLLHTAEGPLSTSADAELDPVLATPQAFAPPPPAQDHVSHVWDWLDPALSPPGLHMTAPTDPSELAPVVFDSHYAFDPAAFTLTYVHTALRNASLLHVAAGAGGVCRAPNVRMPLFDTNTNRVCTRMARAAVNDTPTMPVTHPKRGGGPEERLASLFSAAYLDKYFLPEQCAPSHDDVPWQPTDPQSASAGGLPGWQRLVSVDAQGNTLYRYDSYPVPDAVAPLYPAQEWSADCATVRWAATTTCDPTMAASVSGAREAACARGWLVVGLAYAGYAASPGSMR